MAQCPSDLLWAEGQNLPHPTNMAARGSQGDPTEGNAHWKGALRRAPKDSFLIDQRTILKLFLIIPQTPGLERDNDILYEWIYEHL